MLEPEPCQQTTLTGGLALFAPRRRATVMLQEQATAILGRQAALLLRRQTAGTESEAGGPNLKLGPNLKQEAAAVGALLRGPSTPVCVWDSRPRLGVHRFCDSSRQWRSSQQTKTWCKHRAFAQILL